MPLIKLTNLQLHYGEQIIFDDVALQLDPGDRLCVIGRNGVGKSTLLKVITGETQLDDGNVWRAPTVVVASLSQELPVADDITVYDYVAGGLASVLKDLELYDQAVLDGDMKAIERLQHNIESADGWNLSNRIKQVLTRLDLDGLANMDGLSGGWRRRVALAQALVTQPDVLLLDEPTNHLDIAAIQWLEEQLNSFAGAIVFITHDRAFLKSVANKIGELDRGHLSLWDGSYESFLVFREQELETEARHNALFDKKLAQEEVWIRQGIKARRTRNEGRVRALKEMRQERQQRRTAPKTAKIQQSSGEIASGKLVAELFDVNFGWEGRDIVKDFSTTILRGDKIGLIGPNGIGKTTLLKLILGELQPQSGNVKLGTKLNVAYFDQMRNQLDLEKSAIDNVAEGSDSVEVNGKSRHVISYLQDFLFSGERARTAIKSLSGGERNRILLAKLFSKPCNLLVMDEPTNDLDAETLELLEELLVKFDGTLLLVSHDRDFLDNVVTGSIVFEGNGRISEYVGGYSDWIHQGGKWPELINHSESEQKQTATATDATTENTTTSTVSSKPSSKPVKKLSYKLQRELDGLPALLERLESEVDVMQEAMSGADFFQQEHDVVQAATQALAEKEAELAEKYERWEELEAMQNED